MAGLPVAHPRLPVNMINSLLWRAQLELVKGAVKRGINPVNLIRQGTQDLLAQRQHYAPADLYAPILVRAKSSAGEWAKLEKRDLHWLSSNRPGWSDTSASSGTPTVYVELGVNTTSGADYGKRMWGLDPVPSALVSGGLEVTRVRHPLKIAEFSSALAIVDIPAQYHLGMAHWVTWRHGVRFGTRPREDYDKHLQVFQADQADYIREQAEQGQPDHFGELSSPWFSASQGYWGRL